MIRATPWLIKAIFGTPYPSSKSSSWSSLSLAPSDRPINLLWLAFPNLFQPKKRPSTPSLASSPVAASTTTTTTTAPTTTEGNTDKLVVDSGRDGNVTDNKMDETKDEAIVVVPTYLNDSDDDDDKHNIYLDEKQSFVDSTPSSSFTSMITSSQRSFTKCHERRLVLLIHCMHQLPRLRQFEITPYRKHVQTILENPILPLPLATDLSITKAKRLSELVSEWIPAD
jgi:hypothetical protein